MTEMNRVRIPLVRIFYVLKGFRRYERVVYECAGTYTVDEHAHGKKYQQGECLFLSLRPQSGTVYCLCESHQTFTDHELAALEKEGYLGEVSTEG